jgi:hypothetical protein
MLVPDFKHGQISTTAKQPGVYSLFTLRLRQEAYYCKRAASSMSMPDLTGHQIIFVSLITLDSWEASQLCHNSV